MKSSLTIVLIAAALAANTAANDRFSYVASVRHNMFNFHMCNGVILNDRWILSSARCVDDFDVNTIEVQYGESEPYEVKRNAVRYIFVHPDFEHNTIKNNIALLITSGKIGFVPHIIAPIDLQILPVDDGEVVTVSGWRWAHVSVK